MKEKIMNNYEVIKNYKDNKELRTSFNELAKKTFYINFEDWYQNGYWTDRYNPYSIVMDYNSLISKYVSFLFDVLN